MSKLTKLVNNPKLFFKDAALKKLGASPKNDNSEPKPKPKPKPKPRALKNIETSHVNFYQEISLIIHSGELLSAGANHIIPWIPVFIQADVKFVVLVRNETFFKWLTEEYPWMSIAYARRGVDVEEILSLLPDAKTIFYPSSTGNNIHLVRFNHLHHVFIGHGDSDKASSANKALRLYDEVWTAGQGHIDRFSNSDFDTAHIEFVKVGRPNLRNILLSSQKNWQQRSSNKILYLPTWEGGVEEANYSSIFFSGQIIRQVQKQLDIPMMIKYHPLTGGRDSNLKNINKMTEDIISRETLNANVLDNGIEISTIIPNNNIFICDISGVITECLAADAPIFVYIPVDKNIKVANSNINYEEYCYTYSSVDELIEKMSGVIDGDDYLMEGRKKAIEYFIGYQETLDNKFIEKLRNIYSK
jgi:hypothetical protein